MKWITSSFLQYCYESLEFFFNSRKAWKWRIAKSMTVFLKYRNTSECFTHTCPLCTHSKSRLQTSCQRATLKRRLGHRGEVCQAVQSTNPRGSDRFGSEEWGSLFYLEDRILKSHSGSIKPGLLAGSPSTLFWWFVCLFLSFFSNFYSDVESVTRKKDKHFYLGVCLCSCVFLIRVLFLCRDTITQTTLLKENWGLAYSFRGLVHYHGGECGCRQKDMVLKQ